MKYKFARICKAGSTNTIKLLTSLLNARLGDSKTPALPKGITSDSTNIIQCLCDTLSQEGLVEADGQETKFDQLLDIDLDADDEEEVKEEPPTPLQAMLPQEYFYINTKRTYKVGVAAVEAHRWAKLSNRLFTSFSLSAQALGTSSAAFTELCMTQGIESKQALNVKNRLVAMLDKSAGLGKSSTPEDSKQITEMFNLLLNFLQYLQNLNSMIKDELNSSLPVLFSDKKADSFQEFFDRTESSVRITIETFINILISISKNKLQTLIKLGDDVTEFTKELEDIISSECVLVKLSGLSLLERIILREEFLSYQILKAKNDEAIAKIIKKRDELLAAGKQFKGEIKGMKLGKGTLDYLEFLDKNQVEDFDSFSTLTDISNTDYEKIL